MTDEIREDETEEEDNLVTLVDEDGNEVEYYHIGTIDHKGRWYCVFQLADPQTEEEEEEVAIYELVGEEPDQTLEPIEDETLMEEIFNRFCDEYERYEEDTEN